MKHRTALITAASIAAVVFAGAIAVGANLGILTVADSAPVGQLSPATVAAAETTTAPPTRQAAAATNKTSSSQKYIIKKAGAVKVAFSKTSLRLADVSVTKHWKWELAQTGDKKLTVTFKHGSDTYTFVAELGRHGNVTARVDHPVAKVMPGAPAASSGSSTWAVSPAPSAATPAATGGAHEGGGEQDD